MAKMNLKRSIAMLLVLNMLTGMLPIQALAEEGNTEAPEIVVTITPSEKKESAPAETESAPVEKQEAAPAETESAPVEKQEAAPAETESAPAEKQEAAPAETESAPVETVSAEVASYEDDAANDPAPVSETASFEGVEPELDYDSELTYGEEIGGTVTETTETETDAEGNETVTETTEVVTKGETEDGATVEGKETYVESETTNADGEVIGSDWELDGVEITDKVVAEETGDGEQPEVTVDLILGETTEASAVIKETVEEDTKNGTTTTITETDRTVTAETSDLKTTVNDTDTGLVGDQEIKVNGVLPVYDEDDNGVYGSNGRLLDKDADGNHIGKEDVFDRNFMTVDAAYQDLSKWVVPEGGDFRHVGTGEHSKFYNARVTVTYQKDENGNPLLDENGVPLVESITKKDGTVVNVNGVPATELPDDVSLKPIFDDYNGARPTTFLLMDETGNQVIAYCCDMDTSTKKGSWYSISNLEDSGYYATEESEQHIRSIVLNGYWGTSDVQKEDGSYEVGSLEKLKQDLRAAIESGEMEDSVEIPMVDADGNPVVDENGNQKMEICSMTELLNDLSAGEALLATQSAIWSYSNGHYNTMNGKDGVVVIDPDGYKWNHNPSSDSKDGEAMDDYGSARVDFLYKWLVGLETEEESTVVINEKNFVEDMSITVRDKDEEHENNKDDNKDNDVYNTDLNFKLAFVPGENDDLLVQISYNDLDGNPVNVVRRLAGENAEGQSYEDIKPEEDGSYVLKGLKLSENEDFAFDLRLEGTQYLENGVYFYAPVGGRDVAQSMVGIAEGEKNVDVSLGVTIKFDVDEDNHVVAERRWHRDSDPQRTERETPPPPAEYRLGFGVGQLEVIEEEVPLAAPPQTGDMSILWFAMIALSGCGLCILNLLEKRKCRA